MADGVVANPEPDKNLTDEVAQELYTAVCKRSGAQVKATDAVALLSDSGSQFIQLYGYYPLLKSSFKNILKLVLINPGNSVVIQATTEVQLCRGYKKSECASTSCLQLHVCPQWIKGNCPFGNNNECNLGHNFQNGHEPQLLVSHKLHQLDEASLVSFLRFVITRREARLEQALVQQAFIGDVTRRLMLLGSLHAVPALRRMPNQNTIVQPQSNAPITVNEICGFHLKGTCQYGNACTRFKHNLPYLWQIQLMISGHQSWIPIADLSNKEIEKDFCDVAKETSDLEVKVGEKMYVVNFLDMVAKNGNSSLRIRRLSTASWMRALPGDSYATKWIWHWKTNYNTWEAYNKAAPNDQSDSLSNEKLEESFLLGAENETFTLEQYNYVIDFKKFVQTNQSTGKIREIRRRPKRFITTDQLRELASRPRPRVVQASPAARPSHNGITSPRGWSSMEENVEFLMVVLDSRSPEYLNAEAEFKKTLPETSICKIERIQNPDLWEQYSRKLGRISKKSTGSVAERQLFHGTNEIAVNAICQQGFDWRLCGTHGTAFGKGCYFARDASYSNRYTTKSAQGEQMMFLAKATVGSYALGNPNTVRPPPINTEKPHELHNSCVDNMNDPSIFVVYDNDQAYPLLLITYK